MKYEDCKVDMVVTSNRNKLYKYKVISKDTKKSCSVKEIENGYVYSKIPYMYLKKEGKKCIERQI